MTYWWRSWRACWVGGGRACSAVVCSFAQACSCERGWSCDVLITEFSFGGVLARSCWWRSGEGGQRERGRGRGGAVEGPPRSGADRVETGEVVGGCVLDVGAGLVTDRQSGRDRGGCGG